MHIYEECIRYIEMIKEKQKNPYYRGITMKSIQLIEEEVEILAEYQSYTDGDYFNPTERLEGILNILEIIANE